MSSISLKERKFKPIKIGIEQLLIINLHSEFTSVATEKKRCNLTSMLKLGGKEKQRVQSDSGHVAFLSLIVA